MIKLRRDYPKRPTENGFPYKDPSGVELLAEDFDELIGRVSEFRAMNCLPAGEPEFEVGLFYVEHFPDFVESTDQPIDYEKSDTRAELEAWTMKLWINPPKKMVSAKLAKARTDFCLTCPHLKKWKMEMDNFVDQTIHRRIWILGQGNAGDTGYCSAHKAHAGLLALLEYVKSETPNPCWMQEGALLIEETV